MNNLFFKAESDYRRNEVKKTFTEANRKNVPTLIKWPVLFKRTSKQVQPKCCVA